MYRIKFTDEASRKWRKLDNSIKSGLMRNLQLLVIAVGKREDAEVYKSATKRLMPLDPESRG
jgi:mRNA-degrading endonuclease RelE of RelBE toxin-antitoxin system